MVDLAISGQSIPERQLFLLVVGGDLDGITITDFVTTLEASLFCKGILEIAMVRKKKNQDRILIDRFCPLFGPGFHKSPSNECPIFSYRKNWSL
jgi:hypothetical protein